MRQIAKWTILCVLCAAFGFGATVWVANSERVAQTLVAMLPAPADTASAGVTEPSQPPLAVNESAEPAAEITTEITAEITTEITSEIVANAAADGGETTPLAADLAMADAPMTLGATTLGTLASGHMQVASPQAQVVPGALSAVGTVSVVRDRQVVLNASGRVDEIHVEVGDTVQAGDVLIELDTTYLAWAVEQAEIAFETARINFEEAGDEIKDSDIAVAQANLLLAQEQLAEVSAGPTAAQMAAAESAAAAAWAAYEELQRQPTPAQLTIAQAQLKKAEIALQAAQREFDKIAWLPESAASAAASDLQIATIDYEAAQAAFEEAGLPATEAQLQSALASAQSAQATLDDLRKRPTPAQLAEAEAAVASAEATLNDLLEEQETGPIRIAELNMRNAMITLEQARLALENAQVEAPIDGTVLAVNVTLGQQASNGDVVAVLANTADIQLTVNVEQRDISRITVGQPVEIAIYALASDTFYGVVEQIAPTADATSSFVTFPVIIRFTDGPLEKVLPGMTASAIFLNEEGEPLSPSSSQPQSDLPAAPDADVSPAATPAATATPVATEDASEEAPAADDPTSSEAADEEAADEEAADEADVEPTAEATEEDASDEDASDEDASDDEAATATATPLPEPEPTDTASN